MTLPKKFLLLGILAAAFILLSPTSHAQDKWPTQAITFVVPYPPGGPTDVMARLLSVPMSAKLGVAVIVENKSGLDLRASAS